MMAFFRRQWFIKREFWNWYMWNIMRSMCWLEFLSGSNWMMFLANWTRQGDQLAPTMTMRRYPVPKWEARMKQKEHMEKSDKSTSQTWRYVVRWIYTSRKAKGWRCSVEEEIYLETIKFGEVAVAIEIYFSGGYGPWLIYDDWIITCTAALPCQTFHERLNGWNEMTEKPRHRNELYSVKASIQALCEFHVNKSQWQWCFDAKNRQEKISGASNEAAHSVGNLSVVVPFVFSFGMLGLMCVVLLI